jgi:hypothetical protein
MQGGVNYRDSHVDKKQQKDGHPTRTSILLYRIKAATAHDPGDSKKAANWENSHTE